MLSGVVVLVAVVIVALLGVHVVGERERVAIMRLGQFMGIRGPGVVWAVPFLDKITRVDLEREVPNWRTLSPEQLAAQINRMLTSSEPS